MRLYEKQIETPEYSWEISPRYTISVLIS
jgi:hypothetical protein